MSGGEFTAQQVSAALARVAETAGRGERCPTAEVLWDSAREALPRAEDRQVILHLAECTMCAAAWRLARDFSGLSIAPETIVEPPRAAWRTWAPLAAAAALVVAIAGVGIHLMTRGPVEAPAFRAQQEAWLAPAAGMDAPLPRESFVLRWAPGPDGSTYDVRAATERLAMLARGRRIDKAEFQVPREALEGIPSGGQVLWQVTAHLPDGR